MAWTQSSRRKWWFTDNFLLARNATCSLTESLFKRIQNHQAQLYTHWISPLVCVSTFSQPRFVRYAPSYWTTKVFWDDDTILFLLLYTLSRWASPGVFVWPESIKNLEAKTARGRKKTFCNGLGLTVGCFRCGGAYGILSARRECLLRFGGGWKGWPTFSVRWSSSLYTTPVLQFEHGMVLRPFAAPPLKKQNAFFELFAALYSKLGTSKASWAPVCTEDFPFRYFNCLSRAWFKLNTLRWSPNSRRRSFRCFTVWG